MPKKGVAVCKTCDKEFEGIFPDNRQIWHRYCLQKDQIDSRLFETLQEHHLNTSTKVSISGRGIAGHMNFDVFFEDGTTGEIEANSYLVNYIETSRRSVER